MKQSAAKKQMRERGHESRMPLDRFYSVEFSVRGMELPYQFKIWNVVPKSMCVIVREDSDIMEQIKVGDILSMKYYASDTPGCPESLETKIKHITKDEQGRFKGHYKVGLAILR